MIAYNRLRGLAILAAVLILLPVPGAEARTKKGDKFLKLAQQAESRKDYDAALDYYTQALSQDPQDASYQLGARRIRFQASQVHVEAGLKLRQAGKLEQALVEFQKAFSIDPGSAIAHIEYGNGLILLMGNSGIPEATKLYETAAKSKPADAMERLDVELARSELE